jgi:hypothetical protein
VSRNGHGAHGREVMACKRKGDKDLADVPCFSSKASQLSDRPGSGGHSCRRLRNSGIQPVLPRPSVARTVPRGADGTVGDLLT